MGELVAMMILIGCSSQTICHTLPPEQAVYASRAECEARLKPAILDALSKENEVHGTCADVGSTIFERDVSVTWALSSDGRIDAFTADDDADQSDTSGMIAQR